MSTNFPLWRLRPEDAARIIILEPLKPVERHKFWRKREMRIRPSKRSAPRNDDMQRLALAKVDHKGNLNSYWREFFEEHASEFPIFGVRIGPLMRNGQFDSPPERLANPLPLDRERAPFQGMYSRDAYEQDVAYFEATRALLRENFILGQQGEGPLMDGLIFMRADNLLLAEIDHCKARLRATWAILEQRKLAKQMAQAKPKKREAWHTIKDEAVAMKFKQSGYTVRYLGIHNYQVLMK